MTSYGFAVPKFFMSKFSEKEVHAVTEIALDAFWATVAERLPAAQHGNLSPECAIAMKQAAENAVAEWLTKKP